MYVSNVFRTGGKLFARAISNAECKEKAGGFYVLSCRAKQLGSSEYIYAFGSGFLMKRRFSEKPRGSDILWLLHEAEQTVIGAVKKFENEATELKTNASARIMLRQSSAALYIIRNEREEAYRWKVLNEYDDADGNAVLRIKSGYFVDLLNGFYCDLPSSKTAEAEAVFKKSIAHSATGCSDMIIRLQLKLFCGTETREDCRKLSVLLGGVVLPRADVTHDKEYAIDSSTVNDELLRRSGYSFWHRPYFAMSGYTYMIERLNPYRKEVYDAAKVEGEKMDFNKYQEVVYEIND